MYIVCTVSIEMYPPTNSTAVVVALPSCGSALEKLFLGVRDC